MGLGGYLTWTAVARELHKKYGRKVFPFEKVNDKYVKSIDTPIFHNNPYIQLTYDANLFPMQLNNSQTNYCKNDTPQRAIHRYDKHIIEQICEFYDILRPQIKCELYFTSEEIENVHSVLDNHNVSTNFIVIEPQSNDEYTVNKKYPLDKWQFIVDQLIKDGEVIVQVGRATRDQKLNGVIDLTNKTSFREAAIVISKCKLFLSTEGGLMHAANAVDTKSVIIFTGFIHPNMTAYEKNSNIWIGSDHGPCGMKVFCEKCHENGKNHNPLEIVSAIKEALK